jgi:hypothetical protein
VKECGTECCQTWRATLNASIEELERSGREDRRLTEVHAREAHGCDHFLPPFTASDERVK